MRNNEFEPIYYLIMLRNVPNLISISSVACVMYLIIVQLLLLNREIFDFVLDIEVSSWTSLNIVMSIL